MLGRGADDVIVLELSIAFTRKALYCASRMPDLNALRTAREFFLGGTCTRDDYLCSADQKLLTNAVFKVLEEILILNVVTQEVFYVGKVRDIYTHDLVASH